MSVEISKDDVRDAKDFGVTWCSERMFAKICNRCLDLIDENEQLKEDKKLLYFCHKNLAAVVEAAIEVKDVWPWNKVKGKWVWKGDRDNNAISEAVQHLVEALTKLDGDKK